LLRRRKSWHRMEGQGGVAFWRYFWLNSNSPGKIARKFIRHFTV
jgi:hypothetical protein